MNNRRFTTALMAIIAAAVQAQIAQQSPRLVVNICIDQLSSEYMEQFSQYFGTSGFKELTANGLVYENAQYSFSPVDRSSAIASLMTGTTPYFNGIIGNGWLNKQTLRPASCVDDTGYPGIFTTEYCSPRHILTSTITDELKVATQGKGIVYGIAKQQDAAILSAGHAADGALWKDNYTGSWCTSTYYMKSAPSWLSIFNQHYVTGKKKSEFEMLTELTNLAVMCIEQTGMGHDNLADILNITLDAGVKMETPKDKKQKTDWTTTATQTYINLDRQLADLVATIQSKVGKDNVLFFITGTGYSELPVEEYSQYRIPTGTFYINRTANLLNMYLGALYGSDNYVRGCCRNYIYLNVELIEKKRLKFSDILQISQSFLLQCEGIVNVHTSESLLTASNPRTEPLRNAFNSTVGGHLLIEVAPGWRLLNENTNEVMPVHARTTPFPVIVYGCGIRPQRVTTPVDVDRIAPTISKAIKIRAPNACSEAPLF